MRAQMARLFLLFAALAALGLPAHASRDMVQFGSTIHVAADQSIHDAVCFFCSVEDRGTVDGDIVVFFGNVRVSGHANHDVVNFFGNVTLDNDATIGQDLVSMFGRVRLGENTSIGKDVVALFGSYSAASTVTNGGDRVIQPGWIFWGPFVIFALVVILVVREFRSHRRRQMLRGYPFPPAP